LANLPFLVKPSQNSAVYIPPLEQYLVKGGKPLINKQIFQFPIIYANDFTIGKIAIGWGAHETVADECKAASIKKALITTTGLKGTGIVDEINQILTTNGVATEIYDKITTNPKDYEVMEAYNVFKNAECDGVVSVGGGSSHDCGKAVRIVAANDGRYICDMAMHLAPPWMEEVKKYKPVKLPQITVNTTAGTGAESTYMAVVTNTKMKAKQAVTVMGGAAPRTALIDPLLIRLMPRTIAAWTGWDAFTHAFESVVGRMQSSHYNAAILLRVVKLVAENLREFAYNRMNNVACENMCWAENMAAVGMLFGGGSGIVHGLGIAFGALTGCHHGLANAVMTLPLERYNEPACLDGFAEMARAMGVDTRGMTRLQAADKWFDEAERLLADLDIKTGHLNEQFGLQQKDLEHIVNVYSNEFPREGNIREFNYDDCLKLLEGML
jgi:alcohol dehydrogenase class IV